MKRMLLLLFFCFSTVAGAMAQDDNDKQEKNEDGNRLEALKIAYLTRKLNLTTEEAQKFWPIYNRYTAEIRQARKDGKGDVVDMEERMVNIRKKFKGEFATALNKERVNQFFKADREFGSYIQKELQQRRMNRQNMQRRGGIRQ